MKRYHTEKHIIARRHKEYCQNYGHEPRSVGRLRKTHIGCNRASCQLCHPEKFPKRQPTRQEIQFKKDADSCE